MIVFGARKYVGELGSNRDLVAAHRGRVRPHGGRALFQQAVLELVTEQKPGLLRPRPGYPRNVGVIGNDRVRPCQMALQPPSNTAGSQHGGDPSARPVAVAGKRMDQGRVRPEVRLLTDAGLDLIDTMVPVPRAVGEIVRATPGQAVNQNIVAHPAERGGKARRAQLPATDDGENTQSRDKQYARRAAHGLRLSVRTHWVWLRFVSLVQTFQTTNHGTRMKSSTPRRPIPLSCQPRPT